MNVLLVGGAGFVGSHVAKALFEARFNPITFDNLSTGHRWAVRYGPLVEGDVEDGELLLKTLNECKPVGVIYLASLTNVRDSIANPALYYERNLMGALSLLKTMGAAHVKRVIFSSTAAIYGAPQYTPIDERHRKAPLNAYGKTKWAIEGMIEDFSSAHALQFACLRYFNACGADLSASIGEWHEPETHLIPRAIQTALGKHPLLQIYGDDYPTPDGTALRDYVHVLDLAAAHVQALTYLINTSGSLQVNLGTGTGYSVKQIIETISRFSGKAIPTEIVPRLPQDSPILVADPSEAKRLLGWKPLYSDLETIVSSAWKWHTQAPSLILEKLKDFKNVVY